MHSLVRYGYSFSSHFPAPSAPPQTLAGYAQSPTIIDLSWNPPSAIDINGILQYYVIRVRESETSRSWSFTHVEGEITVGSLHPYYNYWCRVSAYTIGLGPYTNQILVQTQEAGMCMVLSTLFYLLLSMPPQLLIYCHSQQSTIIDLYVHSYIWFMMSPLVI